MTLLARYADCIFWMARYIERAENLARVLDVQETFSRDSRGDHNWLSVVNINADEARFFERHDEPSEANVVRFYLLDQTNPTSILFSVKAARDNARALRPLISTEMWAHLNVFYNWLRGLAAEQASPSALSRLFARIKEACQTHTGITEGTFFRDQSWYFYQLGRMLERADQTTRMVDIKYHQLLPRPTDVGSPIDVSQWNTLLRSAAGYHAYRRVHPSGMSPASVAGFLLLHPGFPRSVATCVAAAEQQIHELRLRFGLRGGNAALESLDEIRSFMADRPIEDFLRMGLHEALDHVQMKLGAVAGAVARDFFDPVRPTPAGLAVQTQG